MYHIHLPLHEIESHLFEVRWIADRHSLGEPFDIVGYPPTIIPASTRPPSFPE